MSASLGRTVNALCTPRIPLFVAVKQSLGRRTSSLKMFDERIRDHRMRRTCFHFLYLYMVIYHTLLGECTLSAPCRAPRLPPHERNILVVYKLGLVTSSRGCTVQHDATAAAWLHCPVSIAMFKCRSRVMSHKGESEGCSHVYVYSVNSGNPADLSVRQLSPGVWLCAKPLPLH